MSTRPKSEMTNTVYIGYDEREKTAYHVLKFSIERIATKGVRVVPITSRSNCGLELLIPTRLFATSR